MSTQFQNSIEQW